MSELSHQIIRWAAYAAMTGLVVGSAGLLGQTVAIAFGAEQSPALIATFGTLAGTSLTGLFGLATVVWTRGERKATDESDKDGG